MKKNVFLFFCLCFVFCVNAQESAEVDADPFTPGLYVTGALGMNLYLAESNRFWNNAPGLPTALSINQNGGFVGNVGAGYDFTPVIGVRMLGSILHHRWPDVRTTNADGSFKEVSFNAQNINWDMTVNLSNWWAGYDPDRIVDVVAFAGLGIAHRDKDNFPTDLYSGIVRGGGQIDFHLTRSFDINLGLQCNFVSDNYNGYVTGTSYDIYTGFTTGVTYHFRDDRGLNGGK
jgi:hypothetical protein